MKKKIKKYSYKEICKILCEACRLNIPVKYHGFSDSSRRYHHRVEETDIKCGASDWMNKTLRKPKNHKEGEYYYAELRKEIKDEGKT